MKSDFKFYHKLRVRFSETDLQGIVFNANYMTFYDVAWTEYFRAVGLTYKDLTECGAETVLASISMEFRQPARFDDVLEVYARVSRIGKTSLVFDFEIYPENQGSLIGSASSLYVCVDSKALTSVRVPDELRTRIAGFEGRDFD